MPGRFLDHVPGSAAAAPPDIEATRDWSCASCSGVAPEGPAAGWDLDEPSLSRAGLNTVVLTYGSDVDASGCEELVSHTGMYSGSSR